MSLNKIYIFTNSYKPVLGGIQTVTSQLVHGLSEDYDVRVITNKYPKNLKEIELVDGVLVNRFYLGNFYRSLNSLKGVLLRLSSVFMFIINIIKLSLLFYKESPKVVNVHFPLHQIKYVLLLKKFFNFKIITSFHGHDVLRWLETSKKSRLYKDQLKLIAVSDEITACSNYLDRAVETIYDLRPQTVKTIYNGTVIAKSHKKEDFNTSHYVFAFGRLEYHKGFDLLIEAFNKIKHDNLKLIIAGSGSCEEDLKSLVNNLNLKDQVNFIGRISKLEIDSYTQNALCNVIPSRREPFGIVVLEAIASGRPVLATNVGGIPEILNKQFGILVEPNIDEIATGLKQLINGFELPTKKVVNDYIEIFSVEKMVENYRELC
ncbi:glycosyltransferase family 4 protein [Flavobacteriaceae bacterium]|nr:glycosyltransferase family 4 protein [Flavobacteriaceae bacterium]